LYKRGLLDIYVDAEFVRAMLDINEKTGRQIAGGKYAVGTYQPAVIVLAKDFSPLFSWASVPTASNIGGAVGRPRAKDVREAINAGLQGDFSLAKWQAPETPKELPSRYFQYVFLALSLANGNFVRPEPFPLDEHGHGSSHPQTQKAFVKLCFSIGTLGAILHGGRPDARVVLGCAAAYVAYIKMAWGQTIQNLWKSGGVDPSKNVLFQRRSKM